MFTLGILKNLFKSEQDSFRRCLRICTGDNCLNYEWRGNDTELKHWRSSTTCNQQNNSKTIFSRGQPKQEKLASVLFKLSWCVGVWKIFAETSGKTDLNLNLFQYFWKTTSETVKPIFKPKPSFLKNNYIFGVFADSSRASLTNLSALRGFTFCDLLLFVIRWGVHIKLFNFFNPHFQNFLPSFFE